MNSWRLFRALNRSQTQILRRLLSYFMAVSVVAAALILRLVFSEQFGVGLVYITFNPAVMFVALAGGVGPGLLATLLSVLAAANWIIPPEGRLTVGGPDAVGLMLFVLLGIAMSIFAGLYHRSRNKVKEYAALTAVREVEGRFRRTFENAAVGITNTDSNGKYLLVNQALCNMLGYTEEELTHKSFFDISHPDDQEPDRVLYRELMSGAIDHYTVEKRFIAKDGRTKWVHLTRSVQMTGTNRYAINIVQDITDRKRAEEVSRENEERLKRSQEIAHVGSWELDIVNDRLLWSDEVYRIFGLEPQSFAATYEAFLDAVHPDDRKTVDDAYSSSLREGRDSYEIEHRVVRKLTGEVRVIHEKCMHLRDSSGRIVRSVGMVQDITDRKRAEQAVLEYAKSHRMVFDSLGDWVHVIDRNFRLVLVNRSLYQFNKEHGLTTDPTARDLFEVYPFLPQSVRGEYEKVFSSGESLITEETTHLGDNEMVTETRKIPVNENGLVKHIISVVRDVTARKKAEQLIQESARRLRMFFESDMFGAVFWDMDGRITSANNKFLGMVGYSRDDLETGRMRWDRLTPSQYEAADEYALSQLKATGVDSPYEKEFIRKDGTRIPIIVGAAMLDDKRFEGLAFVLDISDHKRMEVALRESERRLLLAQEAGHVGSFDWDFVSRKGIWSDQMCLIHGLPRGSFNGKRLTWTRLIHPSDIDALRRQLLDQLRRRAGDIEASYRIVRPNGEMRWVSSQAVILYDEQRKPVRLTGTSTDITERKFVEDQMASSIREKEVMLREIHHRVKNNLQVIASLLRLQAGQLKDPLAVEAFDISQNRVKSIAMVHERLYRSPNLSEIDLSAYLDGLVQEVSNASTRTSAINVHVDAEPLSAEIDVAVPCALIVTELVTNALKHAFPEGRGEVTVSLHREAPEMVALSVRDTGVGLPGDFDISQAESLGLRLVTALAEQIRGHLEVKRNHGTEIRITFPAPARAKAAA